MIKSFHIKTIDDIQIQNKRVIVRVDFDVSLRPDYSIADDTRIERNLPTLKYLLKNHNKLILIAKLGRPHGKEEKYSLKHVVSTLPNYLPGYTFRLVKDFLTEPSETFTHQQDNEIIVLENIRFYKEEKTCEPDYVKKLSSLGDVYVNDAFAMTHRAEASIVGIPHNIPGFAGLLLTQEVNTIVDAVNHSQRPLVTIIGGAKISSKINLIQKLMQKSDYVLLGGALANTFLKAHGYEIGTSLYEYEEIETARKLLNLSQELPVELMLPVDVVASKELSDPHVFPLPLMQKGYSVYDIGPRTAELYSEIILSAQTLIWNGPMGLIEEKPYRDGTQAIYEAFVKNTKAFTLVGGGDTLAALAQKKHLDRIDHISTGGGAMLELIEKGTLPGIEALQKSQKLL